MQQHEPQLSLGLSQPRPANPPAAEDLQFHRAELVGGEDGPSRQCVLCKQLIREDYFHAQGQVVCPLCATKIRVGSQHPPAVSLLRASLYGLGAAIAGSALYAIVNMLLHIQIGIIAIFVGIMVGKAVRYGSKGLGGRRQQILAVALTYFGITLSYIPIFIQGAIHRQRPAQVSSTQQGAPESQSVTPVRQADPQKLGAAILMLVAIALAAPFLIVWSSPLPGLITLFIVFLGLQRAWHLTGRADILITGPYRFSEASS
jgi:hypothetical protein